MYYFLGWPFVTDEQSVTCAGATNPSYLTDWFTSRRLVTASGTSATIIVNLTGAQLVEYVVLYAAVVPSSSLSPTWRAEVYSDLSGGGSQLLDSGVLSAASTFPASYLTGVAGTEPAQLVHVWTTKRVGGSLQPSGTSSAKSIKISLATSGAAEWQFGYIAAGDATAFSTQSRAGAGYNPSAQYSGRSVQTTGAGVTDSRLTAATTYPINLASMNYQDAAQWRMLFDNVADCRPFFLYPSTAPRTRAEQLGIVRFASNRLEIQQRGTRLGTTALYSLKTEVTAWR